MAVSRKYGNAVQRNRLKRRLREHFRQHTIRNTAIDILVYPTNDASLMITSDQMIQAFDRVSEQRHVNR